jgi:hypothetical protein
MPLVTFVCLGCRRGDMHLKPKGLAYVGESAQILGQATASEAEARLHVLAADPLVEPDALDDFEDVCPERFAQHAHLVGE